MESLRQTELRAVSAFLQALYALRDLDGFQRYVLTALPTIVPADRVSYNEANPGARRNAYVSVPALPAEYEPAFLRHMSDHPLITHRQETHDGRALRISDFLPQRRFRRLGLYSEFFRPLRVEYQAAVTLPAPPPLVVGMALSRSRKDFSDRERRLLDLLRPHLVQAYRNADAISRMREEQAVIGRTLDGLPYGLIVLTREGRARTINSAALRLLAAYWGAAPRRGDCLPEDLERWVRHHVAAAGATNTPETPRAPLVLERGDHDLVVRLVDRGDERLLLLE
jgi:hypothetical protein